jgi:hypothetical protein
MNFPQAQANERRFDPAPLLDERYGADGFGPVEPLAEALPAPEELVRGERLVILSGAAPRPGFFGRFRRAAFLHASVRGAALLARGYVDIGGGPQDGAGARHPDGSADDPVWGYPPPGAPRLI